MPECRWGVALQRLRGTPGAFVGAQLVRARSVDAMGSAFLGHEVEQGRQGGARSQRCRQFGSHELDLGAAVAARAEANAAHTPSPVCLNIHPALPSIADRITSS